MQPKWEIWLDNPLSSALAKLMQPEWKLVVKSAYMLQHKDSEDKEIFMQAKQKGNIIIITKKLNAGNLPAQLIWNKYGENFKSAINFF